MAEVSLYIDFRNVEDKNGPATLKLRVYVNRDNIRFFKTKLSLTTDQFNNSYHSKNPRGDNKDLKAKIKATLDKAEKIIEDLGDGFTFEKFENQLYKSSYDKNNIVSYFNEYIKELDTDDRVGTADLYRLTIKSILQFKGGDKPAISINFQTITVKFLDDYEKWFTKEVEGKKTKSLTSVGMYLRNLRFIFNQAIAKGDITADSYPFGKDKYNIPTGSNTKKAIDNETLKIMYKVDLLDDSSLKMARDYWFFSYQCNGMNFKDIASLRFRDISENSFSFKRQKTKRTIKAKNIAPILVPITVPVRDFINKYGNKDHKPDNFVFPIFTRDMNEKEKMKVNRNFIRLVNENMQRLADKLGLKIRIGTMAARHSFTTKVTKAAGLEFAQEALGHTSLNTTQNYWAGFETKVKTEIANSMLDFDEEVKKPVKKWRRKNKIIFI